MKSVAHVVIAGLTLSAAGSSMAQSLFAAPHPQLAGIPFTEVSVKRSAIDELLPIGQSETIYERYPTGEVYIERQVTLDDNRNYVNHGPWKMLDRQGAVISEGEFDMGRRTGVWTRLHTRTNDATFSGFPFNRFQAPFVSTASFKKGVMDGHWLIVDKQERKVIQVSIENGQRHGLVISWLPNGEIARQSNYDRGVPVGDVLVLKTAGEEMQRTATYLKGRKVISKASNYRRGGQKQIQEMYLAPKTVQKTGDSFWDLRFAEYEQVGEEMRHGPSKEWHPNGQLKREGQYNYGKRTGRFVYWHSNGQKLAEGEYREDKQNGRWTWWHENGLKSAIGQYAMGAQTGSWLWWEASGKLIREGIAAGAKEEKTRAAIAPLRLR